MTAIPISSKAAAPPAAYHIQNPAAAVHYRIEFIQNGGVFFADQEGNFVRPLAGHCPGNGVGGVVQDFRRLEDLRLLHGQGFDISVVVELAQHGAHAVIPEAPGVVGGGDEAAAQGVHLRQGTDHTGVTEVIGKGPAGEAGAGRGITA